MTCSSVGGLRTVRAMTERTDPPITRNRLLVAAAVVVAALVAATLWAVAGGGGDPSSPADRAGPAGSTTTAASSGSSSASASAPGSSTGDGSSSGGATGGRSTSGRGVASPGGTGGTSGGTAPRFRSFDHVAEVDCAAAAGAKAPLALSWTSERAVRAYWAPGDRADPASGQPVPTSGDQGDLAWQGEPRGVFQECGHRERYAVTIVLVGANGETTSRTAAFRDVSWPGDEGSAASITSFTGPSTAGCLAAEAPAHQPVVDVTFNWNVVDADEVAFGVATGDAIAAPYQAGLPGGGSITVTFPCSARDQRYTLTAAGGDGRRVSRSITVTNPNAGP